MLNSKSPVGTEVQQSNEVEAMHVKPNLHKTNVSGRFVYTFQYCPCIYESAFSTISIHRTYVGAYKRLKNHKLELFDEWMSQSRWAKINFKFGCSERWAVKKIKIEDD